MNHKTREYVGMFIVFGLAIFVALFLLPLMGGQP